MTKEHRIVPDKYYAQTVKPNIQTCLCLPRQRIKRCTKTIRKMGVRPFRHDPGSIEGTQRFMDAADTLLLLNQARDSYV